MASARATIAPADDIDAFDARRLERLAEIERTHFWFAGRRALVRRLLAEHAPHAATMLDLGCGTGATIETLDRAGRIMVGLDRRPEGIVSLKHRSPTARLMQADARTLPLATGTFDAVTALDVIEHTDDAAALREIGRVLLPGGIAVLTVPAGPWLWSYRDVDAGHLRRYTRRSLEAVVARSGLDLVAVHRYQCLLYPLVLASRLTGRQSRATRDREDRPSRTFNGILTRIALFEVRLGESVKWPWGSSLVIACRRPA